MTDKERKGGRGKEGRVDRQGQKKVEWVERQGQEKGGRGELRDKDRKKEEGGS